MRGNLNTYIWLDNDTRKNKKIYLNLNFFINLLEGGGLHPSYM